MAVKGLKHFFVVEIIIMIIITKTEGLASVCPNVSHISLFLYVFSRRRSPNSEQIEKIPNCSSRLLSTDFKSTSFLY